MANNDAKGISRQFIDRRKFSMKLKKFNNDIKKEIENAVKDIVMSSTDVKAKELTRRDKNVTGEWAGEESARGDLSLLASEYLAQVQIRSYRRNFDADKDARDIGTKGGYYPNVEKLKEWMILRGIGSESEEEFNKALRGIAYAIFRHGTKSSKFQNDNIFDDTIYENLRNEIFDYKKLEARFEKFFANWKR